MGGLFDDQSSSSSESENENQTAPGENNQYQLDFIPKSTQS